MSELIEHVKNSLLKTDNYQSKITDEILKIDGMSGTKTRHFYNNLCSMSGTRYLEIGTWKGSSTCSAMCNNNIKCLAIDNWCEFEGPKDDFLENFNKFKGHNDATFIENNCWNIDTSTIGKFNIYMFDGNHKARSHRMALTYYYPCLDDEFIYIVDDWAMPKVYAGTMEAIKILKLNILYKKEIVPYGSRKNYDNADKNEWWNGIAIFVFKK